MLHREHSDFQWFRERAKSVHSDPISEYSAMASVSAPLNPEPSLPKERADHDLPPKSYADAVVTSNDDVPTASRTSADLVCLEQARPLQSKTAPSSMKIR